MVAVVLSAAVVAGCGNGDDGGDEQAAAEEPTTTTEEQISEDDWVDEASDLCVDWHHEGADLADDGLDDEEYYGQLHDLTEEYAEDLADLGSPEGLEDEASDLVDAVDDLAEALGDSVDAVEAGEDPDDDQDLTDAFDEASADADEAADDADLDGDLAEPEEPAEPTTTAPPATTPPSSGATSVLDLTPIEPSVIIPDYGTQLLLDSYADLCFNGDMGSCDDLYQDSDIDESIYSYEGYGATCGGRLTEEHPGQCQSLV
jgi:hypothetical protein